MGGAPPIQVLVILDVDDTIAESEVVHLLPPTRHSIRTLRLSDCGAPTTKRFGPDPSPVDWEGLAQATVQLAERARAVKADGYPTEYFVVGRAPLAVFTHLGMALSPWVGSQTFLNRRKDQQWDRLPLSEASGAAPTGFFDRVVGIEGPPSEASGRVALFVSAGQVATSEDLRGFIDDLGEGVAGIVEITTLASTVLDAEVLPRVAGDLERLLPEVRRKYPFASGAALFVAGPASLAYCVGRALNQNVIPSVAVADFTGGAYQFALSLPWRGRSAQAISMEPADELARVQVLREMLRGLQAVRESLRAEHLPPFMEANGKKAFIELLQALQVSDEPEGDAFELKIHKSRATLGRSLLDALRPELDTGRLARIAQLLFLHEIFHDSQDLRSSNYRDIGRAGVALEEVDFWADAVAIGTLSTWEIQRGGEAAQAETPTRVAASIEAAIKGMEAFDRSEQGDVLARLYERRLRRYLIWHLQKVRAETLKRPEDVWPLFSERLVVELAPLAGHLDRRFDKVVREPLSQTDLFVVLGHRLLRQPRSSTFDPGTLVEAVRHFDAAALHGAMDTLVGEYRPVLAAWRNSR